MKVSTTCMQCLIENGIPNQEFNYPEINDDGIYKIKCSNGHETISIVQQQKFEILFDLGSMALLDGYPREAVSSFAASLERFYEFCINVYSVRADVSDDEYKRTWKLVGSQSERQLGAFYFLYLIANRKEPPKFEKKYIEFRNNVIHKGFIPSYEEVRKYGEYVYNYIYSIIKELKVNFQECIDTVVMRRIMDAHDKIKPSNSSSLTPTLCLNTIISLVQSNEAMDNKSFKSDLENLKKALELNLYSK